MPAHDSLPSKPKVTLRSSLYGEFDLDELVDRLCHSHAPKPQERDLYNAQIAILRLIEIMRAAPETGAEPGVLEVGLNVDETMVILNHPQIDQDERGGHILFTAAEARHLGELLLKKAGECRELKANVRAPEVCGCPYGQCNCNDGSENEKP